VSQQPYYVLEVRNPDGSTESHEIAEERRILGRSKVKADIQVNDKKASGRHCEIRFVSGNITVKDLGSTNGTIHNGQKSMQFSLGPGASFRLGDTTLRIIAIHGLAEEEAAKTQVSAPAWIEEDEATRAMSPDLIAQVTSHADAPAPPPRAAAPPPRAPDPAPRAPAPAPPAAEPIAEPMAFPEEDEYESAGPPDWAVEASGGGGGVGGGIQQDDPTPAPGQIQAFEQPVGQHAAHAQRGARSTLAPGPIQLDWTGTGKELLKKIMLGYFACIFTLFIYTPWFITGFTKYFYSRISIAGNRGNLHLSYTGTGGKLFVKLFVGYLLSLITLFIYMPWFICSISRYMMENTKVTADDGTVYDLQFELTGGNLFKFVFINGLLTLVTGGIWGVWYWCKMQNLLLSNIFIEQGGQRIGTLEFTGKGGKFFLLCFLNGFLVILTLFIYSAWFQVKVMKFAAEHTKIHVNQRTFAGQFSGKGWAYFKINLWAALLMPLTLGFYMFWFMANKFKFEYGNKSFDEV